MSIGKTTAKADVAPTTAEKAPLSGEDSSLLSLDPSSESEDETRYSAGHTASKEFLKWGFELVSIHDGSAEEALAELRGASTSLLKSARVWGSQGKVDARRRDQIAVTRSAKHGLEVHNSVKHVTQESCKMSDGRSPSAGQALLETVQKKDMGLENGIDGSNWLSLGLTEVADSVGQLLNGVIIVALGWVKVHIAHVKESIEAAEERVCVATEIGQFSLVEPLTAVSNFHFRWVRRAKLNIDNILHVAKLLSLA